MTRGPVRQFVASALVVLVGVSLAATALAAVFARNEAEQEARDTAQVFARTVMAPLHVEEIAMTGPSEAREALELAVAGLLESGEVYRVKVWLIEGDTARVVWSDLPELDGLEVPVSETLREALDTDQPVVVPVPDDEAHATETATGLDLVEVYLPFEDAAGQAAVAELYLVTRTSERTLTLLAHVLPLVIGGPVLLLAATLPLALRLARARAAAERERAELADRALATSEAERHHLARRLHDGLIQDLSALGLALDIDAQRTGTVEQHAALAARVRADIDDLRGVLDDLHPAAVESGDLREAFAAVVRDLGDSPATLTVTGAPLDAVTGEARALIHRCGLELLRNAVAHAGGSTVVVELLDRDGQVGVEVRDDGAGFDPEEIPAGHHGLRLVRAAATEAGASLEIDTSPAGTTARLLL